MRDSWWWCLCGWPVVVTLMGTFILLDAAWLWHFRHGQLLDIDEAGYIGIALQDYQSLAHGGVLAFLRTVTAPSIQAPVTTAAAALVFALIGPHVLAAFAVTVVSGALCIPAAYLLARALGMGRMALLPALLVATCPFIINYSRVFQFSMPTTFLATAALVCLLQSRRMTRLGWSILFGLCAGLLPLSRTMTVAFLPGLLAGMLAYVYLDGRSKWGRQSKILAMALLAALLVAMTWFIPNGRYVFNYLTSFGYGGHAAEFSDGQDSIGLTSLIFTIGALGNYICLPQFVLLLAALPAGFLLLARLYWQIGPGRALLTVLRHPSFPVLCFVAGDVLALSLGLETN
jgi:4-amino-4-deoxy-L-arabinose transferase-like glycosyltransferase